MVSFTWSEDGPTCPHCGFVFCVDENFYYDPNLYREDTCPECERTFDVKVITEFSWECTAREESSERHSVDVPGRPDAAGLADGDQPRDQLRSQDPAPRG